MAFLKRWLQRISLILLGTLVGLLFAEIVLRIVRTDLKNLVDSKYVAHSYRIHTNPRNFAGIRPHPDTLENHLVINNSLGFRQHREFARTKPPDTTRIGVFGDSFTENWRLPVQYSFTEPLDYLLNRTGKSFEVLNFGTDGYGTDQVYLQYVDEGKPLGLDVVVYVYCQNDLADILADRLIEVDEKGEIVYLPRPLRRPIVSLAKKFYLAYFLMEVVAKADFRIDPPMGEEYDAESITTPEEERANRKEFETVPRMLHRNEEHPALNHALQIFSALLDRMNRETESEQSLFCVALVPGTRSARSENHNRRIAEIVREKNIPVLDLYPIFEALEAQRSPPLFFANDTHWNEEGNKVAAIELFRFLAPRLEIEASELFVAEGLFEYYEAFAPGLVEAPFLQKVEVSPLLEDRIEDRFLSLEKKAPASGGEILP